MPEGDTLAGLAGRMRPHLAGAQLTRTAFRVPQLAVADFSGETVTAVRSYGKYLLIQLSNELTIMSHLGMDGMWQRYPRSAATRPRWRRPAHTARVILETGQDQFVGFELARLEVMRAPEVSQLIDDQLGPDILADEFDLDEALLRLRALPQEVTPLGVALLDQTCVAGIGNIYRCELLLLAGLDPHTPLTDVSDQVLADLLLLTRESMMSNLTHPLGTGRITTRVRPDPTAPFGLRVVTTEPSALDARMSRGRRRSMPNFWVYRREREGCYRCGGPIRHEKMAPSDRMGAFERDLYWCPQCQTRPAGS